MRAMTWGRAVGLSPEELGKLVRERGPKHISFDFLVFVGGCGVGLCWEGVGGFRFLGGGSEGV